MRPYYEFSDIERATLYCSCTLVKENPYRDHRAFMREIDALTACEAVPDFLRALCTSIRQERASGASDVHLLRNCPIDSDLPELDLNDPVADKYLKKHSFVGETMLALFARLAATPLLSYGSRNNGDFFTDVIAINRYSGMQTGFSDSELVYHNDRTAHEVRADFISLLGLRCPQEELIYTGYVDGRNLLARLSEADQAILRLPHFITPFDVYSRATNSAQITSEQHPILENHHSFRYIDATTTVHVGAPPAAKDALLAMKNALTLATRVRHRLLDGDLLAFANQDGLHNREKIDISDPERARRRWLLKTYAFRTDEAAAVHAHRWVGDVYGRVRD